MEHLRLQNVICCRFCVSRSIDGNPWAIFKFWHGWRDWNIDKEKKTGHVPWDGAVHVCSNSMCPFRGPATKIAPCTQDTSDQTGQNLLFFLWSSLYFLLCAHIIFYFTSNIQRSLSENFFNSLTKAYVSKIILCPRPSWRDLLICSQIYVCVLLPSFFPSMRKSRHV